MGRLWEWTRWDLGACRDTMGTRMSSLGSIFSPGHPALPRGSAPLPSLFSLLKLALARARGT